MSKATEPEAPTLSDLPDDELVGYGRDLGLDLDFGLGRGELLRRIRRRQELLIELDRQALLDVVVWARRPVRKSAGKEALARQIAQIQHVNFTGLSQTGLEALARLRGLDRRRDEPRPALERRLKRADGFWGRVRRARRGLMAGLIAKAVRTQVPEEYRFLPEEEEASLRSEIQNQGVVGGIASKLKGVADDYVREKLDEIERRIDRKLDEIDQRMGEWRDREVGNRLKILKVTLLVSILVALMSLGYDVVTTRLLPERSPDRAAPTGRVSEVAHERGLDSAGQGPATEGRPNDVREIQPTGGQGH
ncbi:MAG: hypothetical protein GY778_08095 [bacterium]|nr:hypothetical protein [bacterium]